MENNPHISLVSQLVVLVILAIIAVGAYIGTSDGSHEQASVTEQQQIEK